MPTAWPSFLPIALRDGYSVQSADVVTRTEMEGGPVRLRQTAPPGPETIPVSWLMTDDEQRFFRAFWVYEIASGAGLVDMPIRTDGRELTTQTVNFASAPQYEIAGAHQWRVSASLQTRKPEQMTAQEYEAAQHTGTVSAFLDGEDVLHQVTNFEWPPALEDYQ